MKPVIGITGWHHVLSSKLPGKPLQGVLVTDDYSQGIEQVGGLPFIVPYLSNEESIRSLSEKLDGLLLSGGNDVSPSLFGAEPQIGLENVSPERDELEVLLLHEMRKQGKPVLGICRGIQVINAALGGTLYQDLPKYWKGSIQHSQKAPRNHVSHTVHIEPGSRLFSLLGGTDRIRTNSFHHQAVEQVAKGLIATAWDDEGLTEGVESTDGPFLVAVQWHPENLWQNHPKFLGLFRGLVEAAGGRL